MYYIPDSSDQSSKRLVEWYITNHRAPTHVFQGLTRQQFLAGRQPPRIPLEDALNPTRYIASKVLHLYNFNITYNDLRDVASADDVPGILAGTGHPPSNFVITVLSHANSIPSNFVVCHTYLDAKVRTCERTRAMVFYYVYQKTPGGFMPIPVDDPQVSQAIHAQLAFDNLRVL